MLKLGVIGTGWISRDFVDAALSTSKYEFSAVYSRRLDKAKTFAEDFSDVNLYDDLKDLFASDIDVLYIASPNSLHFEHAKEAISNGKNLIVEKPAFSNPDELKEIIELAKENDVFFFEAARNIHEKSYATIKDFLASKTVTGADFTYSKYSSKMKDLLAGNVPNTFSAKFSGGALADLGVYILYAASYFFGQAKEAKYNAVLLETGIDINGVGVLKYDNFNVAVKTAKDLTSNLACEIYTTDGTLTLNEISAIARAEFTDFAGNTTNLDIKKAPAAMMEEASDFADLINENDKVSKTYQDLLNLALIVSETSFEMRQDAGIEFEADKK